MSTAVIEAPTKGVVLRGKRGFYVPSLDGLRTLAFLMVFVDHAFWWENQFPGTPEWARKVWMATVPTCGLGVSLFFVLSSFLITSLLLQERRMTGRIKLGNFYMRRILRIWPLYFLVVAVGIYTAHYLVGKSVRPESIWALITFRTNFGIHPSISQPLGPMWSIALEEQFYLLWPLILKFTNREGLIRIAIALILISNLWRPYAVFMGMSRPELWSHPLDQIDCFGWGALIAIFYRRINLSFLKHKGPAIALVMLALPVLEYFLPFRYHNDHQMWSEGIASAGGIMMALLAIVVLLAAKARDGALVHPVAIELGKRTYGFYCFHMLVLVCLWKLEQKEHYLATVLPGLVLILSIGFLSYRYFEKPFLKLKERFQAVRSGSA